MSIRNQNVFVIFSDDFFVNLLITKSLCEGIVIRQGIYSWFYRRTTHELKRDKFSIDDSKFGDECNGFVDALTDQDGIYPR